MQRRSFLKSLGATAIVGSTLAGALAACGDDDTDASSTPESKPETTGSAVSRDVKVGFIPLTDAASVIMASENGDYAERDLNVTVLKQASWPATRDALLNGDIDMAHALFSMPMSLACGIGGAGERDLRIAMILNNNGQAITLANAFAGAGYADLGAAGEILRSSGAPSLAMTFPGGTHDLWLRYWIKACGVDAAKLSIQPIPPPQMVANMQAGTVQGYCVGEPWNAVAVRQGIGFSHLTTQDLWLNHPEKALVCSARMVEERPEVVRDMIRSVLASSKWLDDPENRSAAADVIGQEQYVNAPADDIRGRLTGRYDLGADLGARDFKGEQMQFFRGGDANAPRRSYVHWTLAQYQRLGYKAEVPDPTTLADELILSDLYAQAAQAEGVEVPDDDMRPFEVRLDDVTFDPADPEAEIARARRRAIPSPSRGVAMSITTPVEPARLHEPLVAQPPAPSPPAQLVPPTVIAAPGSSRALGVARSLALAAAGFALLVALWALISEWRPGIPNPAATFTQMRELLRDPFRDGLGNDKGIFIQLRGTLGRVFKGFGLAAAVGVPAGLVIGAWKPAFKVCNPVIQLLRPVSPLAWYPLWLTAMAGGTGGAGPRAAVGTVFVTALWPTVINTAAGAASVPVDQRNVAQVFRFGRLTYLRHVLIPHSLPSVVTGLRLSMGIAWMVIVAVEMLSGGVGIGFFVWDSYNAFDLAKVICAIGIIGGVGLLLDSAFLKLGRVVAPSEVAS